MAKTFFLVNLLLISFFSLGYSVDRIVLEINETSFTQSQIEIYYFVKTTLKEKNLVKVLILDHKTWPFVLSQFREDMMIELEAQRLGSFNPTDNMIEKAIAIIEDKKTKFTEVANQFSILGIDQTILKRTVALAIRVESFRRSKEKQAVIQGQRALGTTEQWISELEDRSLVRYMEGANSFVQMNFPRGK